MLVFAEFHNIAWYDYKQKQYAKELHGKYMSDGRSLGRTPAISYRAEKNRYKLSLEYILFYQSN